MVDAVQFLAPLMELRYPLTKATPSRAFTDSVLPYLFVSMSINDLDEASECRMWDVKSGSNTTFRARRVHTVIAWTKRHISSACQIA